MKRFLFHWILVLAVLLGHRASIMAQNLPTIIPPSPEAVALFKFQDYPMDYSTGLPQISIPIYEIQSGSLRLPISISYHASGRKVYDQDGPIGVGWSLNAGGGVARTIYGSADFGTGITGTYAFPFPFVISNLSNQNDLLYLEKIMHYENTSATIQPWKDSEYDVFSYSIGSGSGKFIFKDSNGVKTPVLLPYRPIIIEPVVTSSSLSEIKITDESGTLYHFLAGETYSIASYNATSGWMLSKIISADKVDTISFTYGSTNQIRTTISQTAQLIDDWTMSLEPFPSENLTYPETTTAEEYTLSRLTEIRFNQGKVVFNLASGKVSSIQILNVNNQVLKTIELKRSQLASLSELGYTINKLDTLIFKGSNAQRFESYIFDYYPLVSSNGQINVRYCDWWGYYNNSGQHDMVPQYTNLPYIGSGGPGTISVGNPSANRNPSLEPLKSGVLKKITYPAGGITEFIYEKNQCTLNGVTGSPVDGPGLRVYQIKSTDSIGVPLVRTFKYGESGYGSIDLLPDITSMAVEVKYGYISLPNFDPQRGGAYRQRTFFSGFTNELNELANRPVIYTNVTEYHGTESENIGKTAYQYDYSSWAASGMPALVSLTIPKKHIYNFNYWNTPQLTVKSLYKRLPGGGSPTFQKVKEIANTFQTTTTETIKGLHIHRNLHVPQPGTAGTGNWYSEAYVINSGSGNPFPSVPAQIYTFSDYQIQAGHKNLTSTMETDYASDNTSSSKLTSYEYNSKQLLSKTTSTSSDGLPLVQEIKYPFNYTGDALLDQMVTLNMLSYPVEQIESKNAVHMKSMRTTYLNWGTTPARIAPQLVEVKYLSNPYEIYLRHHTHNEKNKVITISKENDAKKSYVWGYNKTYPIAEVTNAVETDIAASSFEENGNGNWTYTGTPHTDPTVPTGKKCYALGNGAITKTGLSSGSSYTLSYWYKTGASIVVSGGSHSGIITGPTKNGWTYTKRSIVGATSITISGGGSIDELRLRPTSALMTTFTYEPLVGITSQCDVEHNIVYYQYDEYQRLVLVRDQDKKIIKKICYNYTGQPGTCPIYYNTEKSGNFTKSCSAPSVGSQVTYTVPVGAHTSTSSQTEADNLATADVNVNGQAYADANGACLSLFKGRNLTSVPWTVTVTGVSETFNGSYSLNPNCIATLLANLPAGVYNISLTPFTNIGSVQLVLNSSTYNGTSFSLSNITINAETTFYLVGSCSITMASGFTSPTKSISNDGTTVSFFIVFSRNSSMSSGNTYQLGTVSQSCRPCAQRSVGFSSNGRIFTITIETNGTMSLTFVSGSPVSMNTIISTPTLNYNL
jgi:hypothetical protein